ncbi:uncharacterized protein LOC141931605 [Strix aluco]|uniref:uncharacterized protein LOC141931605 n=1 Tax=Strix aluco TaxID=111821 RepID=UPI003DA58823
MAGETAQRGGSAMAAGRARAPAAPGRAELCPPSPPRHWPRAGLIPPPPRGSRGAAANGKACDGGEGAGAAVIGKADAAQGWGAGRDGSASQHGGRSGAGRWRPLAAGGACDTPRRDALQGTRRMREGAERPGTLPRCRGWAAPPRRGCPRPGGCPRSGGVPGPGGVRRPRGVPQDGLSPGDAGTRVLPPRGSALPGSRGAVAGCPWGGDPGGPGGTRASGLVPPPAGAAQSRPRGGWWRRLGPAPGAGPARGERDNGTGTSTGTTGLGPALGQRHWDQYCDNGTGTSTGTTALGPVLRQRHWDQRWDNGTGTSAGIAGWNWDPGPPWQTATSPPAAPSPLLAPAARAPSPAGRCRGSTPSGRGGRRCAGTPAPPPPCGAGYTSRTAQGCGSGSAAGLCWSISASTTTGQRAASAGRPPPARLRDPCPAPRPPHPPIPLHGRAPRDANVLPGGRDPRGAERLGLRPAPGGITPARLPPLPLPADAPGTPK